jgi:hypothetical protein
MYLSIKFADEDKKFHRFFHDGKEYEYDSWIFGNAAAPFVALKTMEIIMTQSKLTGVSQRALMNSLYMDDLVTSVETAEEGIEIYQDMVCYSNHHLKFKKWMSSHREVLQQIPVPDRAKLLELLSELPQVTALGMIYMADSDQLTYKGLGPDEGDVLTKRTIASVVSRIFDPIGYLDLLTVRARVVLQELWAFRLLLGVDWDTDLTQIQDEDLKNLLKTWHKVLEDLKRVNEVIFPRPVRKSKPIRIELHMFCDGSGVALGAVGYQVFDYGTHRESSVIMSKKKCNSLRKRSIPQVELLSAVILSRMFNTLNGLIQFDEVFYWSDSLCTLYWIKKEGHRYGVFVMNRITEINDLTDSQYWRHVPTEDNPADKITRGMSLNRFLIDIVWQQGPTWLLKVQDQWPVTSMIMSTEQTAAIAESIQKFAIMLATTRSKSHPNSKPVDYDEREKWGETDLWEESLINPPTDDELVENIQEEPVVVGPNGENMVLVDTNAQWAKT